MNDYSEKIESGITGDSQEKNHLDFKGRYRTRNGFSTFAKIRKVDKSTKLMDNKEDNLPLQAIQSKVTSNKSVPNTIVKISREMKRINATVDNDNDLSIDFHAAMLLAF